MSKRKSIVSSFGDLTNSDQSESKSESVAVTEKSKPVKRVGAGIIGATSRSLTNLREERDQLLESLKDGDKILKIDSNLIDPSPFRDRLPDDDDTDFEELKSNIEAEHQKVPITVRQSPADKSRYQIVYGHRRARALKELGREVEAILRDYSDRDLLVAQGIENANRQDLSWIEKALFVATMENQKIKPKDIKAALSVDDAQLSKFRLATKTLGVEVIEAIGRAPKIGRPRWLELVDHVKTNSELAMILKTLSADKVSGLTSDQIFLLALSTFDEAKSESKRSTVQKSKPLGEIGNATFTKNGIKLSVDKRYQSKFEEYFGNEIDGIVEKFMKSIEGRD